MRETSGSEKLIDYWYSAEGGVWDKLRSGKLNRLEPEK